ncbi:MAG: nucleotidyltransferase family protein [Elusimicrobia bacterium]|nr:nucleotidyltransferase family protein [Elusimicrobiota bacterium]
MKDFQAYLLAAGRGERSQGPKAWRVYEGKPLLEKQVEFLLGRFEPERIAVTIQADWFDRCRGLNADIRWMPVDAEDSPMGALLKLMKASPIENWAFMHHVDMPVWEPGLFDALATAVVQAEEKQVEAIQPRYEWRCGHPVLLSGKLRAAIEASDPVKDRLDRWLHGRKTHPVEVPYPCILQNWNRLSDYPASKE